MRTALVGLLIIVLAAVTEGQIAVTPALPTPTGPFAVGRVTIHPVDRTRIEPLANGQARRELAVDIWYPAERETTPALYLSAAITADQAVVTRLRPYLRGAHDAIVSGAVTTHAFEAAPFARSLQRSPVLVFSHGGGEMKETYSAQLADLASHGYVVASIAHTYDTVVTGLSDGRQVLYSPRRWPPMTTSYFEGVPPTEQANPEQLRWWAQDIRLVLDELDRLNQRGGTMPFTGRLDLSKAGAFGHSFGGEAAATACQLDRRLRACLDQDGLATRAPYYPAADGWGMDQAFMLMVIEGPSGPPPPDALAALNLTLEQALALIRRMDDRQLTTLRNTGGGGYRVTLKSTSASHPDFGDLPLLQSRDRVTANARLAMLSVVRTCTRAFFERTLKNAPLPPLDAPLPGGLVVSVERFAPAKRIRNH